MRASLLAITLCALGCGTLDETTPGSRALPVSRTGPFRVLDLEAMGGRTCVWFEPGVNVTDPAVVREGARWWLYVTKSGAVSRSALANAGQRGDDGAVVLRATEAWQGGAVGGASVTRDGDGWRMVYATAAGLGWARSDDGAAWRVEAAPTLTADASQGELTPLRAPTLWREPDGRWCLAYESAGSVWAACRAGDDGPWARLDGRAETSVRDPVIAPDVIAPDGGSGFQGGSVGDPAALVETTTTGRAHRLLFFTARARPATLDAVGPGVETIGVAGSFDGRVFVAAPAPALVLRADVTLRAPTVLADGDALTWMWFEAACDTRGTRGVRAASLASP